MSRYDVAHIRKCCNLHYRASSEPQVLTISARWSQPYRILPLLLRNVQPAMCEGFAADAVLSPLDTHGQWLKAPHLEGNLGPVAALDGVLRVRSMSEWFVRYLVAMLIPNHTQLSLVGELAPDGGPSSLDTETFLQRDEATEAFPGRWPDVPFELDVDEAPRNASLRVKFAGNVPPDYASGAVGIGARMPLFTGMLTFTFWNRDHSQVASLPLMPKIKLGTREVNVLWDNFDARAEPFTNVLINHLIWVHHREIPIESVSIRVP